MNLAAYLALMAQKNASDLFFSAGAPVSIKIDGITRHVGDSAMPAADIRAMADSIMNDRQKQEFENNLEMNLAFSLAEQGGQGTAKIPTILRIHSELQRCRSGRREVSGELAGCYKDSK